ncbi:MAG: hypothetical protein ACKKL5_04205 [Candidatus Komeilibacteria bacterium]
MKVKNLYLGVALFFLLLPLAGQASEQACKRPADCPVPAPTIILPNADQLTNDVLITGLSWNQTKVDIYIDGVYNGRATLRQDNSGVGNFYYRPFLPLTVGQHQVFAVARNLSEKERSPESQSKEFTVIIHNLPKKTQPSINEAVNNNDIAPTKEKLEDALPLAPTNNHPDVTVDGDVDDSRVDVAPPQSGQVDVGDGRIEGGVSQTNPHEPIINNLQKTADRQEIIEEFFSNDDNIADDEMAEEVLQDNNRDRKVGLGLLLIVFIVVIIMTVAGNRGIAPNKDDAID